MNSLNFQNESPSRVDVFKGESHDRVAQAMHEYLMPKTNHRVIGLDGEFGSGKSSILQMLEMKIAAEKSKTRLWLFDCEQNYQGSIKSNFILQLTDQVTELLKTSGQEKKITEVETNRDIALGRHYSYTKDTRSHISIWAVLLIASGVLTPTFIRDYLIRLHGTVSLPLWLHGAYLLACTAPAFILLLAFIASRRERNPKKRWNLASLLKGSSDDRITETIEVSKEVSPLDLKQALRKQLHAVKDYHIIIVIDNLDRLPRDVLRAVWSDLEIFTSVTGEENLSVIVPFCSTKVSKYLNGDNEQSYDSKDFIAKKFPVVFRTPPIITSGWKDAFRKLWSESFGESNLSDADACSVILQRHSPMAGGLVTPRLQKRFINDIATTMLVTAGKPSVVCIAAYLAICKYNGVAIEEMLKALDTTTLDKKLEGFAEADDETTQPAALNISKTKHTLKTLFGEDMKTGWPIQVLQIHFQTSADIAIAELIDQPLEDAIDAQDGKKLATLVPYFGFKDSFLRRLETTLSPVNLMKTLHHASQMEGCIIDDLLPHVSAKFRNGDQLKIADTEPGYFDSIKKLIELGLSRDIFEKALATSKDAFEEMAEEAYDPEFIETYKETIFKYDNYLESMNAPFEPLTIDSSELLSHMMINNPNLIRIDTRKIKLSETGQRDAVLQLASTEHAKLNRVPLDDNDWLPCFIAYFGQQRLATTPRSYFLDAEPTAEIIKVLHMTPTDHRVWFAAALFGELSSATPSLIQVYLPKIQSNRIKVSMAIIYMRLNADGPLSEIPDIEEAFEAEQEYLDALIRAAVISENLFKLTIEDESMHLVAPVLSRLIKGNAIQNIASTLIYEFYSIITDRLRAYDLTNSEFLGWFTSFNLTPGKVPAITEIDALFLTHLLEGTNAKLLELRTYILDRSFGKGVDASEWTRILESASTNENTALKYMLDHKIDFAGEASAHQAVSNWLTTIVKQDKFIKPSPLVIENSKLLLNLFEKDTRSIIGTMLRPFIYDLKISVDASIFILGEYGDLLPTITPRTSEEEERLLQVLLQMNNDPDSAKSAASFIDSRAHQFDDWKISNEHKDTYASQITKLKEHLPVIYANLSDQHGNKGRMQKIAKALLSKK
ncbi:P-loop NTPase fold protein [Pseudomonas machongensis]